MPSIACPACGAPAAGDPDGICNYCREHLPKDPPPAPAAQHLPPQQLVVVQPGRGPGCTIAAVVVGVVVLAVGGSLAWIGFVAARGVSDVTAEMRKASEEAQAEGAVFSAADVGEAASPQVVGPRARLVVTGAETFDGTISIGAVCDRLIQGSLQLTITDGPTSWAIVAAPPTASSGAGTHPIGGKEAKAFVSVNKIAGGTTATWGSLQQAGASGVINRGADGSFDVAFAALPALDGPANGTVTGSLQLRCA